jgi:starch phosphorylase
MSMLNIANMAWFSSDRTISEYARDIWNVPIEGRS